jgi:hypothetical protein
MISASARCAALGAGQCRGAIVSTMSPFLCSYRAAVRHASAEGLSSQLGQRSDLLV